MNRRVLHKVKGYKTVDGAGVSLVRVLRESTIEDFSPFLMLDSFESKNPEDYIAGFPTHPHRGIETISYLAKGRMVHSDSVGNREEINSGEVQWMTAGSGILHGEQIPAVDELLGVQLWLNLPAKDKMVKPEYKSITNSEIQNIEIEGGILRLLCGNYKEFKGHKSKYLPLDYYDVQLRENSKFEIDVEHDKSIMLFTLKGTIYVNGELIGEKTAVKLSDGDKVEFETKAEKAQVLFLSSEKLEEPVAWAGPIVMNTREELRVASNELREGTFLKD